MLNERIKGVKDKVVIVAAEALTVPRAKRVADALGVDRVASILERRGAAERTLESLQLVRSVEGNAARSPPPQTSLPSPRIHNLKQQPTSGSICIIVDTLIDTGTTLVKV